MFSRSVRRFAQKKAIEWFGKSITYAELDTRSHQLAAQLRDGGVEEGAPVAILSDDPIQMINAILAVMKAGCAFMPLDSTTPESRWKAALAVTATRCFIADSKYAGKISAMTDSANLPARLICLDGSNPTGLPGSPTLEVFHYGDSGAPADLPAAIRSTLAARSRHCAIGVLIGR